MIKDIEREEKAAALAEIAEEDQMLLECGREAARSWLNSCIENSDNEDQMYNQLEILKNAAVHLLATICFNEADPDHGVEQLEARTFTHVMEVKDEISEEVQFLLDQYKDGKVPKVLPGGGEA